VVILTLGLLLWDRFAVVARTTTMQVRNLDYIAAAQAAGCLTLASSAARGASQYCQSFGGGGNAGNGTGDPA